MVLIEDLLLLAKKMKKALGNHQTPLNIIATMNAGFIPKDVWVHDMEIGGGRIIGEACHYIDLCSYLAGSKVDFCLHECNGYKSRRKYR